MTRNARHLGHRDHVRHPEILIVDEVAQLLRVSPRTIFEFTRKRAIPHRRLAGSRRLWFLRSEIRSWLDGAELEIVTDSAGGRIVRPVKRTSENVAETRR